MSFYDDFDDVILAADNYSDGPGPVVAIIIHDEEYPERDSAPYDVAGFFARPTTDASTHGVHGNISSVGCVPYGKAAWHSGAGSPWNSRTEGYEHSGYAHQTRAEWLDPYGIAMLERSAKHTAKRLHETGIPCRWIDEHQLRHAVLVTANPADGGVCDHWTITRAAGVKGGHTDCGPNFPADYYMSRVEHYYNGGEDQVPTPETPDPVVHPGPAGPYPADPMFTAQTINVQRVLNELGFNAGPEDGIFGSKTTAAVHAFQRVAFDTEGNRLVVDGIVGPKTWTSMNVCLYLHRLDAGNVTYPEPTSGPPFTWRHMSLTAPMMNGADISTLQRRLNDRGYGVVVDGLFGPATDAAVKAFQSDQGLGAVDGIVGPITWTALWA